jgi:hypothetical protein
MHHPHPFVLPRWWRWRRHAAALAAVLALALAPPPTGAQAPAPEPAAAAAEQTEPARPAPAPAPAPEAPDRPAEGPQGFPAPLWMALLLAATCGAIGAFAADLVTDGGRIEQWRRDEAGWSLGFLAKMVVGLVAAVIFLTLNPPSDAWPALVGTALAAGVGGEAILLAIIASRRAQAAEIERAHAEKKVEETFDAWTENVRTFESLAHTAGRQPAAVVFTDEAESDGAADVVSVYADRAIAEIARRRGVPAAG